MRIHNLYVDDQGETHFRDIEVEWGEQTASGRLSKRLPATGIIFREVQPTYDLDWHPAPRRQYIITLSGEVEIEIGDGTIKRFGKGDIMLADDTTGRGHITRVLGNQPRIYVTIPLK